MPEFPSVDDIHRALTVIALFGCAAKDAKTPEQMERLQSNANRLKEPPDQVPLEAVVRRVFDIMGPDWNPTRTEGAWGEWMQSLLDERKSDG